MHFLGMTTGSVYIDDCAELSADKISQHYGADTEHRPHPHNQTGASMLSDKEFSDVLSEASETGDSDDEELRDLPSSACKILDGLDQMMECVHVPRYPGPFHNNKNQLLLFKQALAQLQANRVIPNGYGMQPEEWEDNKYPSYEVLQSGKGIQKLRVDLPDYVWQLKAEKWVQGLEMMNYMMEHGL
ncbi:hypothetical protein Moror_17034 [Moniliophthora roreri MCA 2997]|uniref:Uncharacterized protein n=2 Tax=Moniliophthora roreri TaxID=221103 RepID=V2WRF7_MONRO|nr:hypothetical protein Moror_17034 [Moniliophthora roreri MCA 2997]